MPRIIKNNLTIFSIIIIVNLFLFVCFQKLNNPVINKVDFTDNPYQPKEYLLTPKNESALIDHNIVYYPDVKISPKDKNYQKELLIEKLTLYFNKEDCMLYADKRIAELAKWSNDADWHKLLKDYKGIVNGCIDDTNRKNEQVKTLIEIKQKIKTHQIYLDNILFSLNKSAQENIKLQKFIDSTYRSLYQKIDHYLPNYQANNLQYPLFLIKTNREYGYYQAWISRDEIPISYNKSVQFEVNNVSYYGTIDKESNSLIFDNIKIEPDSQLRLKLPEDKIIKSSQWSENISKTNPNNYIYSIETNSFDPLLKYIIELKYKVDKPLIIQLERQYTTNIEPLFSEMIYPHQHQSVYYKVFPVSNALQSEYKTYFTIISKEKLSEKQLKLIRLSFQPIYEPEVLLIKTGNLSLAKPKVVYQWLSKNQYRIITANISFDQQMFINNSLGFGWKIDGKGIATYWLPQSIIKIIVIVNLLLLLFITYPLLITKLAHISKKTLCHILKKLFHPFAYILKIIRITIEKARILLLLIAFIGIYNETFKIPENSDLITFFLILVWLGVIIGFRLQGEINYIIVLILLIIDARMLLLKIPFQPDKAATWAYIFLVIGTIQITLETIFNKHNSNIYQFINKIAKSNLFVILVKIFKVIIYKANYVVKQIVRFAIKLFRKIINTKPKNITEFINSLVKLFLLLIALILLVFFSIKLVISINRIITEYQKKQHVLEVTPKIYTIEPGIVYRSTKVIIFGKEFNESKGLYSQYGRVSTDFWDDTKIIFTVPFEWQTGQIKLWLKKQINYDDDDKILKSNVITIKLIPVTGNFTDDDGEYFNQLNNLDPETLKINGY